MSTQLPWLRLGRRISGLLAAVVALSTIAAAQSANDVAVTLPDDPASAIIVLSEHPGELAVTDALTVTLRADGTAHIHRPAYMTAPGDRAIQLDDGEFRELLALVARAVVEASPDVIRAQQARLRGNTFFTVADGAITRFRVRLAGYSRAGGPQLGEVSREISWRALPMHAQRYPTIRQLQDLAAARARLLALMERTQ